MFKNKIKNMHIKHKTYALNQIGKWQWASLGPPLGPSLLRQGSPWPTAGSPLGYPGRPWAEPALRLDLEWYLGVKAFWSNPLSRYFSSESDFIACARLTSDGKWRKLELSFVASALLLGIISSKSHRSGTTEQLSFLGFQPVPLRSWFISVGWFSLTRSNISAVTVSTQTPVIS